MKREYVVIDEEGSVSWNPKTDGPEMFKNFNAAKARSVELAHEAPGKIIRIYELTAETVVPLGTVNTSRAHPIEHYRKP